MRRVWGACLCAFVGRQSKQSGVLRQAGSFPSSSSCRLWTLAVPPGQYSSTMPRHLRSTKRRAASSSASFPSSVGNDDNRAPDPPKTKKKKVSKKKLNSTATRISAATGSTTVETLQHAIVENLQKEATKTTKDWFTNYVKGTTWIGCKLPTVRQCVHAVIPPTSKKKKKKSSEDTRTEENSLSSQLLLDTAVQLLQQPECDVKLAGMLILGECFPRNLDSEDDDDDNNNNKTMFPLSSTMVLDRLERDVLQADMVNDWSSTDWFANKVLRPLVFQAEPEHFRHELVYRVLNYAQTGNNIWYRRCAVIPFILYYKDRDVLPAHFVTKYIEACETSLLTSPSERFTQTGIAWALRYVVTAPKYGTQGERQEAMEMILRHGPLWTAEAKKSITEKLSKNDRLAVQLRKH